MLCCNYLLFIVFPSLQFVIGYNNELVASPIVQTKWGPIQGTQRDGVTVFLGVPFAAPPVGRNRLRSPVPPQPWIEALPCVKPRARCAQFKFVDKLPIFVGKEDCLYLDVYVPSSVSLKRYVNNASAPLVPVMQWIYGGGFFEGADDVKVYNGSDLAKKYNVVVVAGDYRVGSLGFIALDELIQESEVNATGNYGMHDQTAAMQWTRDNIEAFGGDPNKVTIFGQSAGAMSVAFHLASPASKGLFHRAIIESGSGDIPMFFSNYNRTRSFSEDFLRGLGCEKSNSSVNLAECARNLTTTQIMGDVLVNHAKGPGFRPALNPLMPWGMTLDNSSIGLTLRPVDAVKAGVWNHVPVILGSVANEGSLFVPVLSYVASSSFPLTEESANKTLLHVFGHNTTVLDAINQQYPPSMFPNNDDRCGQLIRDYCFSCGLRRLAAAIHNDTQENAYLYHFTFKDDRAAELLLGVFHSAELIYVFDNGPHGNFSVRERKMADIFGQLWTSFATNGVPTSSLTPPWPAYSPEKDPIMIFNVPSTVKTGFLAKQCDFWDRLSLWNNPDV